MSAVLSIGGKANFAVRSRQRRENAFDAQPHCGRVADKRQLDRLAGQRLGLPCEQCRGGDGRLVAAADSTAGRVPDRPLSNGRPRTRPGGFDAIPSVINISSAQPAGHSRGRPRPTYDVLIRQFYDHRHRRRIRMIQSDAPLLVFPAKEAVRKLSDAPRKLSDAPRGELQRGGACFETRPQFKPGAGSLGAPQHEVIL